MRDIKFRAWDGINMLDSGNISEHYIGDLNGYFTDVMQYTGLKDRKGKEIYEYDILQGTEAIPTYMVYWDECRFLLKNKYGRWGNLSDFPKAVNEFNVPFEVIGNIYENPELL